MEQPRLKAIYQDRRKPYEIDTCEPQVRAVREGKIKLHALTKGHYPGAKLSSSVLPGLNSIGFWDGAGAQDWGLDEHRNEGVEISLLETGKMGFTADQRHYDLVPGSLTITRPWQLHKIGDPNIGPGRLHWLIFDVRVRRPSQEWRWPAWLVLTPRDLAQLTRKLRHSEMPVSLQELWTLDMMAKQCGMGVTTFSKYARELVNTGPMEFLGQCRLQHAARQLSEQPSLSVTDIAFGNGFNSS